jgi:murein DD-endopeptidase MepM/ murein hydrolase activator NlpD
MFLAALLGSLLAYRRFSARMPLAAPGERPAADAGNSPEQAGLTPGTAATGTAATGTQGVAATAGTGPPAQAVQLIRPLPGQRQVLQPFGFATSREYGDFRLHPGVDYTATLGESVLAAAPGRVAEIEADPADGMVIVLDHGNGMTTRYASLGQVVVGLNASVQSGEVLAQVGMPAPARSSIGTHLHFEVLLKGEAVDPAMYLSK